MAIDKTKFITPTQLAKLLGISRVAVHQKIKKGEITAENIGDPSKPTYLIPKDSLSDDLKKRIQDQKEKITESVVGKDAHHHDLNFEKELWAAADKLRGNIDVSEYKNIVLGLLFLKYISDAFYKRREELDALTRDPKNEDFYVKDDKAREQILETKDFYKSAGVFYVPEKSRWEYLQTKTMQSDIGQVLDKAMEHIEDDNRAELEGVLPKIYTRTTLDHSVIGELVNIFSRISFDHNFDREKDILGRIYEYFLGQFASSEGKRGGEFFTPRSIVKLLVEILEPYENARVLDPACGSGGMFVAMGEYLRNHGEDPSKLAINGQESNQNTLRLAKMNLAIRGLSGKIELGNTYYQDKFPHLQADFVIANPPFNGEWEPSKLSDNDPRITLGTPPSGNANFMWVQHFAHHLAPNGLAGFVMPNGALSASGKEKELLQKLVEVDMIDVIISCPSKLFYNVTLPVSLWFLAKNKSGDRFRKRKGETLFIDARNIFEQISRKQVVFNTDQINYIANTVRAWRGESGVGEYKDVIGFCKSVTQDEIISKHFILTPDRYVGLRAVEDDGIPFEDKLAKLSSEIKTLLEKSTELRNRISENIKEFSRHSKSSAKWNLVKLGDVADVQWGDTNTTKASYKSEGYLAYSAAGPDGFLDHYDFDRDGIVLSAIGANCGETWFAHGKWSCIKNTIRFWGIDGKADTRILYYVTHNKDLWPQRGSAQPFISQTDARNMEILLPDFDEQKRLSDLLRPFDEEIETTQAEVQKLVLLRDLLVTHLLNKNIK